MVFTAALQACSRSAALTLPVSALSSLVTLVFVLRMLVRRFPTVSCLFRVQGACSNNPREEAECSCSNLCDKHTAAKFDCFLQHGNSGGESVLFFSHSCIIHSSIVFRVDRAHAIHDRQLFFFPFNHTPKCINQWLATAFFS